jgi:hypothetical protein
MRRLALQAPVLVLLLLTGCSCSSGPLSWRAELQQGAPPATQGAPQARAPQRFTWHERARLPAPYRQVGDLVSTPEGLIIAASIDALTVDGAAIFRLGPDGSLERLFKWDGQGFLRVAALGNHLFVPDADPPFGVLDYAFSGDVEGYVFVSDVEGKFDEDWREVLPASYHVFDVARLAGGLLVASTGAYPQGETAYFADHAPAALFGDDGPDKPWRRLLEYPSREAAGVSRFTWLLPLADGALLAGIQTSRGDLPHAVRIEGLQDAPRVVAVTGLPNEPLRWFAWRDRVFALTAADGSRDRLTGRLRQTVLLVSRDGGRSFAPVPGAPGLPLALASLGESLYLLDGGALYRSPDGEHFKQVSEPSLELLEKPTLLVNHTLVVHGGSLWSANPLTGQLLEAVPEP